MSRFYLLHNGCTRTESVERPETSARLSEWRPLLNKASCISILASAICASCLQAQVRLAPQNPRTSSDRSSSLKLRSMHLRGDVSEVLENGFALYGIQVVLVSAVHSTSGPLKIDADDADLATAGNLLGAMTHCFFVPLNSHLILAVPDNKENRSKFERQTTETLIVPNLALTNPQELSSLGQLLTGVFGVTKPSVDGDRVALHTSPELLYQISNTLRSLFRPEPQVLLEVKTYLISRTHDKNLGVQLPQGITVFNVYTEAESLISSNSSIVQELIEEGLVSAGDTLGIAELLIADGYAGSSVLGSSSLYFGGGDTATGVQFDSVTANASLSVSSVKEIQEGKLHLADGQSGTFRVGQRYPVLTATTSATGSTSSSSTTPSIQYEDLGLTLEAKPHVLAGREVLVHLHETIRSLAGTSLNDIPILDNEEISTDLTMPDGVTTVLVSDLSRTESLATQGIADSIPTNDSRDLDESQLVITITPIATRDALSMDSTKR